MFLTNVDQSHIAVLSNIGTTETAFSLIGGGPAVLGGFSDPIVDGVPFKLVLAGKIHPVTSGSDIGLYIGNSATLASNQTLFSAGSQGGTSDRNFLVEIKFLWDSVSQILNFVDAQSIGLSGVSPIAVTGVASQTGLQFVASGKFSSSNASNSITVTQFKLDTL